MPKSTPSARRRRATLGARDRERAEALGLSPEVAWYLKDRGIPWPTCRPIIQTPSPGEALGAQFHPDRVDRALVVFHHLRHTQGEWAGRPLDPDPWQIAYVIAPVFGWVAPVESGGFARIVRKLYVEVPRKNGKTTMCGGFAILLTCADDEPGAQVIAAAGAEKQARYLFDPVKAIATKSPALASKVKAYQAKIVHPGSMSTFSVVANTADLLHGANIHGAIVDELHVHKTPDLLEALETGTGSRRQPLVVVITTADDGRQATPYDTRRRRVEALAHRTLEDPTMFGVVWAAPADADPFAEATWRLANPGYGVSPTVGFMRSAAAEAQSSPADLAKFLRLHLGIRTRQETKYLTLPSWDANLTDVVEDELAGRVAYGGLDLASTSDLTALAWDFPDGHGGHDVLWRHWLPEGALDEFDKRTAGMGTVWAREGWLVLTPGNVTDYDFVRAQIGRDRVAYAVRELAYDPWNSSQLVNDLTAEGAPMVQQRQGFASMSPPTKELLRVVLKGAERTEGAGPLYRHGGNPLVRWQVDNLGVAMDPAGNVKPDKARSGDKIDGLVAGIMALDRAMRHQAAKVSAYERRGITVA